MTACTYPKCGRPAVAHGLCGGHNQQRVREQPLHALRAAHGALGAEALLPLSFRVPASVVKALGDRPGEQARQILERWAKRAKR